MKAFVSWSGGKDCMFALHRFLDNPQNEVACLVHFTHSLTNASRSHRVGKELTTAQAEALGIPLIIQVTDTQLYREHLIQVIRNLKPAGITTGVFGDICLLEHRDWIEAVCKEAGITACFPLWGRNTEDVARDFVEKGFRAQVVAVKDRPELHPFVGKELDSNLITALCNLEGVDPCGENGEYHTFVFDGPGFSHPVSFHTAPRTEKHSQHLFKSIHHV